MSPRRALSRIALAFGLVVVAANPAYAGVSPQGDTASPWPAAWSTYRLADGSPILDVLGDENPDNSDLSSGPCVGSGCTGTSPTVYYASDGTTAFFRMRLAVDPADVTKGGLTGNAYLVQIAVGGTVVAVAGVDGKHASVDYVYVASAPGTTVTEIYTYPFTSPSAGMRVVPDGAGDYFLDLQVPIARLTTISGGALTSSTPIQLYYGSSAAANLATLNKDLMRGDVNAVSFTGLATISLSPSTLSATSGATVLSGPATPEVGSTTRYTVTWTMTNSGGGELSPAAATATLPSGVAFVSGSGVSVSGTTVTWNAGLLLPGETDTVSFAVDLTPPPGSEGTTIPLLSALSATGTDVGTSSARTASAPALTATVAAAPPVNGVPVAAADTLTVAEDASGSVDVLANDSDPDGDALTVTVTGAPAHGSTSVAGGVVTYTPSPDYSGPDSFTYTACDPSGACAPATVTVTVTPVNDAPSALAGTAFSTPEDTATSGSLPAGSDVDGDALVYGVTTLPAHGTVVVDPDGSYTYTPAPGYSGPDSFGYQVCDAAPLCSAAVATVTVTPVNDGPGALAGTSFSTPEDTPHSGSLPAASDPDGDALAYSVTTAATNGSVVVNPDGTFTYTPAPNYAGPDSFGYQACDAGPLCSSAVATVTVTPVNDAPSALAGTSFSTPEDTAKSGSLPAGSDVDGDALVYSATTLPAHGSVVVEPDGSYTYTPALDYNGPDSFGYHVCDAGPLCSSAVATVTVTPVNDAPAALAGTAFSTAEDTAHSGALPAGSDVDGDALAYSVTTLPAHGTVVVAPDGSFTYTPAPGYNGPDSFGYQVCDAGPLCSAAVATVTVTPVNDAPAALAGTAFSTAEDTAHSGALPAGSDPDGDALTYSATTLPAHGTVVVAPDGSFTYTPDPDYTGPDSFGYEVCDAGPLCSAAVATVTVTPVNDAPGPLAGTAFSTDEDTPYSGTLPGSTDPDGDALEYGVTTLPAHGTVVIDPDGSFTYTPAPGYDGPDSFGYQVCDADEACAGAVATVTVVPAPPTPNAPPVAVDDAATTAFGTAVLVDVAANDTDTDPLTVTAVTQGASGTVAIGAGGVTYTPGSGFSGTDTFTYTVCDPATACDTGTVTVTVLPQPNAPPVADAGPDQLSVGSAPVQLDGTGSSDADGDPLTYSWTQVSGPAVTWAGATTATPTVTLPAGSTVVLMLTVSDGTAIGTDTVTVTRPAVVVDWFPPACDDTTVRTTAAGVDIEIDCEVVGDVTVTVVGAPAHGDVTVLDDGTVRYVPDPGYTGPDSFTLRVCNPGGCASSVITVLHPTVRRPSRGPTALPNTGGGFVPVLLPVAFVLVLLGAAAQRRGARA